MSFELNLEDYAVDTATAQWLAIPRTCRCVSGVGVVTEAVTVDDSVVTISDGTTTIGTFTFSTGDAIGDTVEMAYSADVDLDPDIPMRILSDGVSTAAGARFTFTFSDFLAD